MKLRSLRFLLAFSLLLVFGIPKPVWAETPNKILPADIKIEQWTGHSFTFHALPADMQSDGYEIFTLDHATQGFAGDRSVRIPYAKHVGKQITVTAITSFTHSQKEQLSRLAGYNQQEYLVYMTVNDTGEKLIGRSLRGQLEGLVLTSDLNNARQQFLGKIVYPKFRGLSGLTLPGLNTTPEEVLTKIGSPVTVVDIYLGIQSQNPIDLIVSANGKKAVLPISYSWTNRQIEDWSQTPPWQDALFMEDPRMSLGGSPATWTQIENGNIEIGMTKGHVLLSWGKPPYRNEDNDTVWIYNTKKLTFDGDKLHSIEDSKQTSTLK